VSTINNQSKPVFTVVLPTYNRADLLKRAIQSVVSQTFPDFELIVVDDASSDDTTECVKSFSDSRIRYVRHDTNRGVSAARNSAILGAKGAFITFLDDDDESYPDLLSATHRAFESEPATVGFAWSGIRRVQVTQGEEIHLKDRQWSPDVKPSRPLEYLTVGTGYGLTVLRSCFDTIGLFDETLHSFVDTDLLVRLGSRFAFTIVPGIHIKRYIHGGRQLTDFTPERISASARLLHKHADLLETNLAAWMHLNLKIAKMHYQSGCSSEGRLILLKMLRKRPLEPVIWRLLLHHEVRRTKVLERTDSQDDRSQ
jgi:glycosyltransferase involved in cell wall biosynthesis